MSWLPEEERPINSADEEPAGDFDQAPVKCRCAHCHGNIITFIDYEPSWKTYTMAIIVIFVSGWFTVCIIPLLWPVFKDVVHYCPRCLNVLARRSRVQIVTNKESPDVMTLKFGNCAMVLSRRYLCFFLAVTSVVLLFHLYRTYNIPGEVSVLDLRMGEISPLTWEDFLRDCGARSSLGNPIHVHAAFEQKYRNHTFEWTGTVEAIDLGWNYFFWHSASRIWVSMPHHQFLNIKADLDLIFPPQKGKELSVEDLKLKEQIKFIATFAMHLGSRGSPHPMRLHSLERLGTVLDEAKMEEDEENTNTKKDAKVDKGAEESEEGGVIQEEANVKEAAVEKEGGIINEPQVDEGAPAENNAEP